MKKLLLLFLPLMFITVITCKKRYEEGPLISLRQPEKRLLGKWKIEKILVNEIDMTTYVLNDLGFDTLFYEISIKREPSSGHRYFNVELKSNYSLIEFGYPSTLYEDKIHLYIYTPCCLFTSCTINNPFIPLYSDTCETWKINRLSGKKLWIDMASKSNTSKVYFKKIYTL